jgi:hypothetical protein
MKRINDDIEKNQGQGSISKNHNEENKSQKEHWATKHLSVWGYAIGGHKDLVDKYRNDNSADAKNHPEP